MRSRLLLALAALVAVSGLAACDTGYSGEPLGNQPPSTFLAVRDTSLVENICTQTPTGPVCSQDDDLFTSTVSVAWGGTDPDGFVVGFELRYFDVSEQPGPDQRWSFTTRRDTLILLPLPPGQATAQVVFEVRAIDNEGARDPNPARTVFPIGNTPPTLTLLRAETPPDTTWTVFSFGFEARDPDGPQDLQAVEIAFNDTTSWTALPPDASFATFVVESPPPGAAEAPARVFLGRGFSSTTITVPGVRLDAPNRLFVRAIDRTLATSTVSSYPDPDLNETWVVRRPTSRVLLVNDFRSVRAPQAMVFHRSVLQNYLGAGVAFDEWDLSRPNSGPAATSEYSDMLPPTPNPTLRETLRQWDFIYWVSDGVTDGVRGNNLALAAPLFDRFLEEGGKLFVQVPFTAPLGGIIDLDNPAYDLLPSERIVVGPSGAPPNLAIQNNAAVLPVQPIPGTGRVLPELRAARLAFTLPYTLNPTAAIPLYRGTFVDRDANNAPWTGSSFVASIDSDLRVGLLALQLYTANRFDFIGPGNDPMAPRLAVQYILEGLGFPGTPEG